jgi:DNA-binding CsgD family transcriptional regulator
MCVEEATMETSHLSIAEDHVPTRRGFHSSIDPPDDPENLGGTPEKHADNRQLAQSHSLLTSREEEIMRLRSKGQSYKDIAAELFISENTVRVHLQNSYSKLGVKSTVEALAKFRWLLSPQRK